MTESRFDKEAASWDDKPAVVEAAKLAAKAIMDNVPLSLHSVCMEFGCGTGIVSEVIHSHVKKIIGVDSSSGMIDMFSRKITAKKLDNVTAHCMFLCDDKQFSGEKFDVIFSNLTMHHIKDVTAIILLLSAYLNPGGYLAIVDFEKTDTSELFHPKEKHKDVEYHGFTKTDLQSYTHKTNQFENIKVENVFSISKCPVDKPDVLMDFGMLLLVAQKVK